MQKVTSQVTAGAITPPVIGPTGSIKLHYVVVTLGLLMAVAGLGFWITLPRESRTEPVLSSTPSLSQTSADYTMEMKPLPAVPAPPIVPVVHHADILHDDIYFEVGRRGLTDEAKALLQKQTEFMKANPDWGVLVQGHTDQQGSESYNQILGLKRAETVKSYLIHLGVSEHAIKVVSLGKAGALCADTSDQCRRMNRRVHLEFRNIGLVHMTPPAPAVAQPLSEPIEDLTPVETETVAVPADEHESSTVTATGTESEAIH